MMMPSMTLSLFFDIAVNISHPDLTPIEQLLNRKTKAGERETYCLLHAYVQKRTTWKVSVVGSQSITSSKASSFFFSQHDDVII